MFDKIKSYFERAWQWIVALWQKHDDQLQIMVENILPMVIHMASRDDLSGEEKKQALVDAILDNAELTAERVANSMINEAIEVAANRYNIQIGRITAESMDRAASAVLKASRDFADDKLNLSGKEAEDAGISQPRFLSEEEL